MVICPSGHSSSTDDYCDVCGTRIGGAPPAAASVPRPGAAPPTAALPLGAPPAGPRGEVCPDCGTPRADRFCEECGYDFAAPAQPHQASPPHPPDPAPGSAPLTVPGPAAQAPVPPQAPMPAPQPLGPMPAPQAEAPMPAPQTLVPMPAPQAPPTGTGPSQPWRLPNPPPPGPAHPSGATWTAVITADRDYYEFVLASDGPDAAGIAFPPYYPQRRIPLTGAQIRIGRRSQSRGVPEIDLSEPPGDPGVSRTHAVLLAQQDGGWTLVDPGSANGTLLNESTEPLAINVQIPLNDGDRIHLGAWTTITIQRG